MSNVELRLKNEDMGIRGPSEFVLLLDTSYLILKFISVLASCFSLLFNIEYRTPIEELRSGNS